MLIAMMYIYMNIQVLLQSSYFCAIVFSTDILIIVSCLKDSFLCYKLAALKTHNYKCKFLQAYPGDISVIQKQFIYSLKLSLCMCM